MKVPVSQREYTRQADGSITVKRIGESPFVFITEELLEVCRPTKDGLVKIHRELFRIVQPHVFRGMYVGGCDIALAMKESVIAQLLREYYRILVPLNRKIARWEARWRSDFKNGERLPLWSISGLFARTFVEY